MLEELSNIRKVLPSFRSFRNLPPLARREFRSGMLFLSPWSSFSGFHSPAELATFFFSFLISYYDGILSSRFAVLNYKHIKYPQSEPGRTQFPVGHDQVGLIAFLRHFWPLGIAFDDKILGRISFA